MTVILGTTYEAQPGQIANFRNILDQGAAITKKLGGKAHRLAGYVGAPAGLVTVALEFPTFAAMAEFTVTREEDRDWQEFVQLVSAAPVAKFVRSFDAIEVPGLETSDPIKSGAMHVTLLDPIPGKQKELAGQLHDLKAAHEKEGARVHIMRQATGEFGGKLSYSVEFDNVIELGKFADRLERNMGYQDTLAKINADPACRIQRSVSWRAL